MAGFTSGSKNRLIICEGQLNCIEGSRGKGNLKGKKELVSQQEKQAMVGMDI